MAAITWADVSAVAPDVATVPALAQTIILAHVNLAFDPTMFGGEDHPKLRLARIYYAAHLGKMGLISSSASSGGSGGGGGGAGSFVTSESVGGISRSYGSLISGSGSGGGSGGGGDYTGTVYGTMLNALINASPARLPVVI